MDDATPEESKPKGIKPANLTAIIIAAVAVALSGIGGGYAYWTHHESTGYHAAVEQAGKADKALMKAVDEAHEAAYRKLSTPKLTRALLEAVQRQQPPRARGGRPKPRYAHQGGSNPPVIVIHGNALEDIGESYRRYLEGYFREAFNLAGTPLRIEFRTKDNPYVKDIAVRFRYLWDRLLYERERLSFHIRRISNRATVR